MNKLFNTLIITFAILSAIFYSGGDYYSERTYVSMIDSQSGISNKIVLNDAQTIDITYSQNKLLNPVDKQYSFSEIFMNYIWPTDVHFFQMKTYGEYCKSCVQNKALLNDELPADVVYYQSGYSSQKQNSYQL